MKFIKNWLEKKFLEAKSYAEKMAAKQAKREEDAKLLLIAKLAEVKQETAPLRLTFADSHSYSQDCDALVIYAAGADSHIYKVTVVPSGYYAIQSTAC